MPPLTPNNEDVPALTPTSKQTAHSKNETTITCEPKLRYSIFPTSTRYERMFEMRKTHARLGAETTGNRVADVGGQAIATTQRSTTPPRKQLLCIKGEDSEKRYNIVEQIVDADPRSLQIPPFLQSPPKGRRSRSSLRSLGSDITALPPMPTRSASPLAKQSHQGLFNVRIKSLLMSRGSIKRSDFVRNNR